MFCTIPEALDELKNGRMVVLVDDEDRENEGDLVLAAEKATPEAMNFILRYGRGTDCLALTSETCERLRLHPQTSTNTGSSCTIGLPSVSRSPTPPLQTARFGWLSTGEV